MSIKHTLQEYSVQEAQNQQLGQAGYIYISTSSGLAATTGEDHWIAYTVLGTDGKTLVSIVTSGGHSPDDTTEFSLAPAPLGTTIYGSFKNIAITRVGGGGGSGTAAIIAYKG
tara:strand:+ start:17883 stop:18221 length:339 start_codon:yes stop_codon:yes gene_type:complete